MPTFDCTLLFLRTDSEAQQPIVCKLAGVAEAAVASFLVVFADTTLQGLCDNHEARDGGNELGEPSKEWTESASSAFTAGADVLDPQRAAHVAQAAAEWSSPACAACRTMTLQAWDVERPKRAFEPAKRSTEPCASSIPGRATRRVLEDPCTWSWRWRARFYWHTAWEMPFC